jgi:hypothetical protein
VEEELWINDVARIPINKPTTGLEVFDKRVSAKPFPNNLNEEPIKSILNRNK